MGPEVSRWLASWPPLVDVEEAKHRIAVAQSEAEAGHAVHWVIERRDDGRVIGWVRVMRRDGDPARGELGFWLGEAFQRCGFATEAVRAAVPAGFASLELATIEGGAQPMNEASQKVMQRVGMVRSDERTVWASARQRHEQCVFYRIDRAQVAESD
jgi:ribosomal-protein-alanine N-acetyltransferase